MTDDEPPSFITIRTPEKAADATRSDLYQLSLELTAHLHRVTEAAATERYHLKEKLDRLGTMVAMTLSQLEELPTTSARSAAQRKARQAATECRAILDIVQQRNTVDAAILEPARAAVAELLTRLGEPA